MLPPIRYPLPSLVLIVALSLLAWRGEAWSRPWRARLAEQWRRIVEGPPVPSSTNPMTIAGPVTRRGLMLRDLTPATERPDARAVEASVGHSFVDIFDVWPTTGPPTHYRVGNRSAIGWVKAADLLPWDTRLVLRVPGEGLVASDASGATRKLSSRSPLLPVVGWNEGQVEVVTWEPGRPWEAVGRRLRIATGDIPLEAWGVLVEQGETWRMLWATAREPAEGVFLRAVVGRLSDRKSWSPEDQAAVRSWLPAVLFLGRAPAGTAEQRAAEINARRTDDVAWTGLSFQFVPLNALP